MTNSVKGRPVTAHVFEYTTSFALDPDMHFKYPDKGIVPCQIIFCMKEKNVGLKQVANLTSRPRKSTRTAGSSTLLPLCSNPTSVFCWTLVPCQDPNRSIISGKRSTSTRMSEVPVVRSQCTKERAGESC